MMEQELLLSELGVTLTDNGTSKPESLRTALPIPRPVVNSSNQGREGAHKQCVTGVVRALRVTAE